MTDIDAEIAELDARLRELRKERRREYQREYMREYWQRPEVKEKRREYRQRPEVKLRRKLRDAGFSKEAIAAEIRRMKDAESAE